MSKEFFSKEIDMTFLKKNVDRTKNYNHYKNVCKQINNHKKQNVPCPVCGQKNEIRQIFITIYNIDYISCNVCSHVYQDYLIDEKELIKISLEVSNKMSRQLYEDDSKSRYRLEKVVMPKIKFALKNFPKNFKGEWLDVGCGTGELVKAVSDLGWKSSGIDNNNSSIKYAKEKYGIELHNGDVEKTKKGFFKNYDIISIFLLFEHLRNPKLFFKNIAEGCKPGALVITEVNNANSLSTMIQKRFPNKVDRHLLPCSHTNMFNYESINYFFNSFGFTLFSEWWFGQDFYELINSISDEKHPNVSFSTLIKKSNDFQNLIDKEKFSDRVIYIFRKQ